MRPLTPRHVEVLKEALFRELNNLEPIGMQYTQSARGLIIRGLLEAKEFFDVRGKQITAFKLTDGGYEYLKNLAQEVQALKATTKPVGTVKLNGPSTSS